VFSKESYEDALPRNLSSLNELLSNRSSTSAKPAQVPLPPAEAGESDGQNAEPSADEHRVAEEPETGKARVEEGEKPAASTEAPQQSEGSEDGQTGHAAEDKTEGDPDSSSEAKSPLRRRSSCRKVTEQKTCQDADLIGSRIAKVFEGHGIFWGLVASQTDEKYYYCVYDDGDSEDLPTDQVLAAVQLAKSLGLTDLERTAGKKISATSDVSSAFADEEVEEFTADEDGEVQVVTSVLDEVTTKVPFSKEQTTPTSGEDLVGASSVVGH